MRNVLIFVLMCLPYSLARAEEVSVEGVPFITQSPPGDWQDNKNCGPTSALMLSDYYHEKTPSEEKLKALIDWLYAKQYIVPQAEAEYYDGNATTATQVAGVLNSYFSLGSVVKKNDKDMKFVKDKLSKGNPLIVGVNIDMDPNKSGHFMVLIGVKDDKVVVHDPGKSGGAKNEYAQSQFMKSWKTSNYASVFVDTSDVSWHPDGSLVQVSGSPEIHLIAEGQTHWIVNESVFKAHGFDWQKVIFISLNEFVCLSAGNPVDWEPYRELFRVGETYYLMEQGAFGEPNCSVYKFSSAFAFNSWNIAGEVAALDEAAAQAKYFAPCTNGEILFVRAGTLLKPTFAVPEYGAGVIFVASGNGVLLPFTDWSTFAVMGYDKLPLTLVSENDFVSSFLSFGSLIDKAQSEVCVTGEGFVIAAEDPVGAEDDNPDAEAEEGDNDNPAVCLAETELCDGVDNDCDGAIDEGVLNACGVCGELLPEVCDGIDNDCDGTIDEGADCEDGFVCEEGECLEVVEVILPEEESMPPEETSIEEVTEEESKPPEETTEEQEEEDVVSLPDPDDEDPVDEPKYLVNAAEQIICSVECPAGMKAYIWYADVGQVSGQPAIMESSKSEVCLRGQPWIDFNCACVTPQEWSCFDPGVAKVECNHAFALQIPGVIDAKGEGEVWFTDFQCFPD